MKRQEIAKNFIESFRRPDGIDWSYVPNDQIANWWLALRDKELLELVEEIEKLGFEDENGEGAYFISSATSIIKEKMK